MMRWLALSVMLSGCYFGPVFSLYSPSKRTCEVDFHIWGGGLSYHVLQGRGDGYFDYDPYGSHATRTQGHLDFDNGDFWWTTDYSSDSYRAQDYVLGYGNLWRTGDLDVGYQRAVTFRDEEVHFEDVRTLRLGCEETTRIERRDGEVMVIRGEYVPGGFTYTKQYLWGPLAVHHQGVLQNDQRWIETADIQEGPLRLQLTEEYSPDGITHRNFSTNDGRTDLRGEWLRTRDGAIELDYRSRVAGGPEQDWAYAVDAVGNGSGEWRQGSEVCDLRIQRFECFRESCNGGATGPCQFPLPWPSPL